jgi:hypothetical protein
MLKCGYDELHGRPRSWYEMLGATTAGWCWGYLWGPADVLLFLKNLVPYK